MKRRQVVTGLLAAATMGVVSPTGVRRAQWLASAPPRLEQPLVATSDTLEDGVEMSPAIDERDPPPVDPSQDREQAVALTVADKGREFAKDYRDDVYVSTEDTPLLHSVVLRLSRVQRLIGHGNYNLVSFDDTLVYAKRYASIGSFTAAELAFIEKMFFTQAEAYGFYGAKVTTTLEDRIAQSKVIKIPHSGHYLFKEAAFGYYDKLCKDVGSGIILTSGVRSNVKQLHLFLAKTISVKGNLSRASRSLAPPGHSYHGIGDFDVGKVGWGSKNFTQAFADTREFQKMQDLGYIDIRYTEDNQLGVRFEPWHIKVV